MRLFHPITSILAAASALLLAGSVSASPFAMTPAPSDYCPGPSQYQQLSEPDRTNKMTQFMDPSKAGGAPVGDTLYCPSLASTVTLGDGGYIVLTFDHNVTDDPANPGGYDFIIYGNAYFIGASSTRWQEPGFVEISQDKINWYLIPGSPAVSELASKHATGLSSVAIQGYVDYTPTLGLPSNRTAEEFYTFPDRPSVQNNLDLLNVDEVSGGGDAFDIATAVCESSPGVPTSIPAGITWFRYVRVTDSLREGSNPFTEISTEVDAAADVAPAITVGAARRLPAGSYVPIWDAEVTAVFPGEGFFIEQPDRSGAIEVVSTDAVAEGDSVAVTGHISSQNGNQVITDTLVTILAHGDSTDPIGISGRTASADMLGGMLVKVWGKKISDGQGYVTIDDGSGREIKIDYGQLQVTPANAPLVTAIGVLTKDQAGNPVVRIRKATDVSL